MDVSNKDHVGVVSTILCPMTHQQESMVSGYNTHTAAYQTWSSFPDQKDVLISNHLSKSKCGYVA